MSPIQCLIWCTHFEAQVFFGFQQMLFCVKSQFSLDFGPFLIRLCGQTDCLIGMNGKKFRYILLILVKGCQVSRVGRLYFHFFY